LLSCGHRRRNGRAGTTVVKHRRRVRNTRTGNLAHPPLLRDVIHLLGRARSCPGILLRTDRRHSRGLLQTWIWRHVWVWRSGSSCRCCHSGGLNTRHAVMHVLLRHRVLRLIHIVGLSRRWLMLLRGKNWWCLRKMLSWWWSDVVATCRTRVTSLNMRLWMRGLRLLLVLGVFHHPKGGWTEWWDALLSFEAITLLWMQRHKTE
jgi:hypothetical protein